MEILSASFVWDECDVLLSIASANFKYYRFNNAGRISFY